MSDQGWFDIPDWNPDPTPPVHPKKEEAKYRTSWAKTCYVCGKDGRNQKIRSYATCDICICLDCSSRIEESNV